MSITATIQSLNSAPLSGVPVGYLLTITNASGSNVNVTGLAPFATTSTGAVAPVVFGTLPVNSVALPVVVPGSSSLTIPFTATFFIGTQGTSLPPNNGLAGTSPASIASTYTVGVNVYVSDGSAATATGGTTELVQPITLPTYTPPGPGMLRFESNLESGLLSFCGLP